MVTERNLSRCEISLLKSLSTIHNNSSRGSLGPRPRRHSINDNAPMKQPIPKVDVQSNQPSPKIQYHRGHRRATVSGPAQQVRSQTLATGVSKSNNDMKVTTTPSQNNRLSFSRRQDGSIHTRTSGFDVNASLKETTNCRPLRDSMSRLPLPPPRTSSTESFKSSFSAAIQQNRMVHLPFANASVSPSSSRPVRRHSTTEMEKLRKTDEAKVQEAAATTSIPPLPFSRSRSVDHSQRNRIQAYSGGRSDYSLGDIASRSHMIIPDDPQDAFNLVSRLKQYDFAFIKRTDGSWTYALLAYRYVDEGKECMLFVLDQGGLMKVIKKTQWSNFIRMVADQKVMKCKPSNPSSPRIISVDSSDVDDSSMI
jgi:hypothetical protein